MLNFYQTYRDSELVLLLKTGNEKAFSEIYDRYWDKLYLVAYHGTESDDESKEIVQNIFLDIWRRRTSIHLQYSLSTYLLTAVKYQVINFLAARSRRRRFESSQGHLSVISNDTLHKIDFDELQRIVARSVKSLPEKCRIVFELKQQGLSQKEIAADLQISEKTVENQLATARAKLKLGLTGSGTMLLYLLKIIFFQD